MSERKYRSARTGEYVTEEFAIAHPNTTVEEIDDEDEQEDES